MSTEPLTSRICPRNIDEIIFQQRLVGPRGIIRRIVDTRKLTSMVPYDPPDIGRTSITRVVPGSTQRKFRQLNVVTNAKKDIQLIVKEAKMSGQVILLLDEIHRLDKAKQGFSLPHLEDGKVVLIGATTSSPYHVINLMIRSRVQILELYPLNDEDVRQALTRAMEDDEDGLKTYQPETDEDTMTHFFTQSQNDVRSVLDALGLAVLSADSDKDGHRYATLQDTKDCLQGDAFVSDRNNDIYYDVMSTFQKSIHGSDVSAALRYLARLTEAGDLPTIVRRLPVTSCEDTGLASSDAGQRTLAAIESTERLDLPEAGIPLSQAVIELCLSPRSNSAMSAIDSALSDVRNGHAGQIPNHLKDERYRNTKDLGRSTGHKYPYQYVNGYVSQQHLPDRLRNKVYYEPKATSKSE